MNNTPSKNTLFLSIELILLFFTHSTETSYAINLELLATVAAGATNLPPLPIPLTEETQCPPPLYIPYSDLPPLIEFPPMPIQLAEETQCPPLLYFSIPSSAISTPLELENSNFFNSATAPETASSSSKHRFECGQCKKSFSFESNLKIHERAHIEENPYKCNECDYTASYSGELETHKKIHTDKKSFKCNQCNYTSPHSGNLKNHTRIHTKERRTYTCNECKHAFSRLSILKNHRKIHTGERPCTCSACGRPFANSENLISHQKDTHPELFQSQPTQNGENHE